MPQVRYSISIPQALGHLAVIHEGSREASTLRQVCKQCFSLGYLVLVVYGDVSTPACMDVKLVLGISLPWPSTRYASQVASPGLGHCIICSFEPFSTAQIAGCLFSSFTYLPYTICSSKFIPESLPYPVNFDISKYAVTVLYP